MAQQYPIKALCEVLGVPRSSYYAWLGREPGRRALDNQRLRENLSRLFVSHRKVYGSPRLTVCLQRLGIGCSRNRVARHMRALQLKAHHKRAFKPKTTDSHHPNPIAQNLLPQGARPARTNRVWVSDITYVFTAEGWLYLAAVMDLYSRKIVGWATSTSLETSLVREALHQALADRRPAAGLLHHSDRGSQYASSAYRALLHSCHIRPSMSAAGNCYDNAAMESFWSTLKTEWLHHKNFPSHQAARLAIFDYIETFYNPKRLHSALGYQSPVDFEQINTHEYSSKTCVQVFGASPLRFRWRVLSRFVG
jgi:putative transposase